MIPGVTTAWVQRLGQFYRQAKAGTGFWLLGRALAHDPIGRGGNLMQIARAVTQPSMPAVPKFLPPKIALEVTNRCNLSCNTCILGTDRAYRNYSRRDMSYDEFRFILNQIPSLVHVWLNGFGEPTLNEALPRMVADANQRGLTTAIITNGTLLTEPMINQLICSGLTEMGVSINTMDPHRFAQFNGGASLIHIQDSLTRLVRTRKRMRSAYPKISVWSIWMRDTALAAPEIIFEAAKLGASHVHFLDYITGLGMVDNDCQKLDESPSRTRELRRAGFNHRIGITHHKMGNGRGACLHPWLAPFISAEGYVMPCCYIADPSQLNFGNIFNTDFLTIWQSAEYSRFRRDFRKKPPCICVNCPCY